MILFMWQDGMMGLVHYVDACLEQYLYASS